MFRRRVRIFFAPDEGGGGGAQGSVGGDAGTSTGSSSEGAAQGQGQSQGQGTPPQGGSQPDPYGGSSLSLGDDFLSRVDPSHKTILEPYVKQWDAGVTRRFQALHSQLEPYQQLGLPADQLQAAAATYQLLDQNPQALFDILKKELEGGDGEQGAEGLGEGGEGDPFQGLPPNVRQEFAQMKQALEVLAQHTLNQQTSTAQQREDAQLDEYLGLMKQEYGEFDEDYVLAKMAKGMDGADAVKAFQGLGRPKPGTGGGRPPMSVLSGGGSVPAEAQNITKASRTDTKSLVASLLQQAAEQGS